MPELLLEIFSEEIPARMQGRAAADLERLLAERLTAAGLKGERTRTFVGPRRLAVVVDGLPARSADVREEKKGPRVDAPKQAIDGFLRSAGLKSVEECEVRDDKKGAFYVAVVSKTGRATADVVAEGLPELLRSFPWPKSMRSGSGTFRWVRPIHRILCVFDGAVVPFEVEGIESGDETEGHRLLGRGPFKAKSFAQYKDALEGKGAITLDAAARREKILADAKKLCAAKGLELVEDAGLLDEVGGLAEHPVVLLGDMDPSFLDLPPEVIRLTMRTHQKYFAVRDPKTGGLAPKFVVVANQNAPDGGVAIAAGNARVLSARLNDARYFWDNDRKKPLADMAAELKGIVFHQKLGSVADKVERVAALARELAPAVGADPDLAEKAARLAKADLVSGMVGEFPELQGVMGRYYAQQQGENAKVADAIRDHYKPAGAGDVVPTEPTAIAVALADKFDTLLAFWLIGEKPTGSGDPYALRRAALGVIRIVLENELRVGIGQAAIPFVIGVLAADRPNYNQAVERFVAAFPVPAGPEQEALLRRVAHSAILDKLKKIDLQPLIDVMPIYGGVRDFILERLEHYMRDKGVRAEFIRASTTNVGAGVEVGGVRGDAVEDRLDIIVKRVEALGRFLDTEDGKTLLAAYRRATNILRDEEKKDGKSYDGEPAAASLAEPEEKKLHAALTAAAAKVDAAVKAEKFEDAMAALAPLRPVVDGFFEKVMVNAPDKALRENRLKLLSRFRAALSGVADFAKIAG